MGKKDIPEPEKIADISDGMSIWRVHLDSLRERDINARVMDDDKFRRLTQNIKDEGMIESFPLVHKVDFERNEFEIISGHHRTRAARSAGVMVVPVIAIERELSRDEVTAKQLAHNALAGYDDKDVLRELYFSIEDINRRIESGLSDMDLDDVELPNIGVDEIKVNFDLEPVYILFMKRNADDFENLIDSIEGSEGAKRYLADKSDFNNFAKLVNRVSKYEDIRNIASIMSAIIRMARERLNQIEEEKKDDKQ